MRIHQLLPLFLTATLVALNSCVQHTGLMPEPRPSAGARDLADQVFHKINRYRSRNRLPMLERHEGLDQLALAHTQRLVEKRGSSWVHGKNVNHIGAEWRAETAYARYGMQRFGENVAAILSGPDDTAEHLLLMWKTSYPHNRTMLGNWTHSGLSVLIDDDGAVFATQIFTSRK